MRGFLGMRGHVFRGPLLVLIVGSLVIVGSRLLPVDRFLAPADQPSPLPSVGTIKPGTGTETATASTDNVTATSTRQQPNAGGAPVEAGQSAVDSGRAMSSDAAAEPAGLAGQEEQQRADVEAQRQADLQRQHEEAAAERRRVEAELQRQAEQQAQREREAEQAARREREAAAAREAERAARRQREAEVAAAREAELAEQRRQAAEAAAKPGLRVFVEADVDDRAGLGSFSRASYASELKQELGTVAGEVLGPAAVAIGDDNLPFRELMRLGRDGVDQLCRQAGSARVLLADVTIEAAGFSSVDSAYWPHLQIVAANCESGLTQRSRRQRLEPHRLDRFGFQRRFTEMARAFISSQEYFLRP